MAPPESDGFPATTSGETPAALAGTLTLYSMAVIAFVGLAPFRFRIPERVEMSWNTTAFDVVTNAILFLVPGFLYRLARSPRALMVEFEAFLLGFLLSFLIEVGQLMLPGRVSSPVDVFVNSGGAWAGALLAGIAKRRLDRHLADRLALELPLMGLFYLLVPVLWLHSLAGLAGTTSLGAALVLGLFGANLAAAVWVHRLRESGGLSADAVSVLTGAWYLVSTLPAFPLRPRFILASALGVALTVRVLTWVPQAFSTRGRRFEGPTLRRAFPLFLAYVAVQEIHTWVGDLRPWHSTYWISELGAVPGVLPVLDVLAWLAAFVAFGYMVAEAGGRRPGSGFLRSLGAAVALAGAIELSRGLHPRFDASFLRGTLSVSAALLGAALYYRQLRAIRLWLASGREAPAAAMAPQAPPLVETLETAD